METIIDFEIVKTLKSEINKLKNDLAVAENELENIIIENNELKRKNQRLDQEKQIFKDLSQRLPTNGSNIMSRKKKKKLLQGGSSSSLNSTPIKMSLSQIAYLDRLEKQIVELHTELQIHQEEIVRLNETIELLSQKQPEPINNLDQPRNNASKSGGTNQHKITQHVHRMNIQENLQICHHITPKVGIKILLRDIEEKLKNFTKDDYCIVLIGEQDFLTRQNYNDLVEFIHQKFGKVSTYTNIMIIMLQYKLGKINYNYRIETFNRLLYLCTNQFKYGLFFDSNQHLRPDHFSRATGMLTDRGMKMIIYRMMGTVTEDIKIKDDSIISQPNQHEESFDQDVSIDNQDNMHSEDVFFRD
ncbi:hypothetical protein O0L34_g19341 [Tuta absoluta]|nr:hypothetical protein O0L34_g19341 [Tuta absoluta]